MSHILASQSKASGHLFCLIGGLAVNQYAEPVVTLDADFAVAASLGVAEALRGQGFIVEGFAHSINAQLPGSRLRLQITVNSRYASFPARAIEGKIFDVAMPVACLDDVIRGKLWAFEDPTRRASKRANLIRLCETHPNVIASIPPALIPEIDEMREQ